MLKVKTKCLDMQNWCCKIHRHVHEIFTGASDNIHRISFRKQRSTLNTFRYLKFCHNFFTPIWHLPNEDRDFCLTRDDAAFFPSSLEDNDSELQARNRHSFKAWDNQSNSTHLFNYMSPTHCIWKKANFSEQDNSIDYWSPYVIN